MSVFAALKLVASQLKISEQIAAFLTEKHGQAHNKSQLSPNKQLGEG